MKKKQPIAHDNQWNCCFMFYFENFSLSHLIIMPSMGIANKYLKKNEPNQDPFRLYTVEEQIVG